MATKEEIARGASSTAKQRKKDDDFVNRANEYVAKPARTSIQEYLRLQTAAAVRQAIAKEERGTAHGPTVLDLFSLLVTQQGDKYEFGYNVDLSDKNPEKFDCSELVEWACRQLKIAPEMPDRSWRQWQHCRKEKSLIPVVRGILTPGALLFRFLSDPDADGRPEYAHVAISLGNGMTFEASQELRGVGVFTAEGRVWTHAALIPGLEYEQSVVSRTLFGEVVS